MKYFTYIIALQFALMLCFFIFKWLAPYHFGYIYSIDIRITTREQSCILSVSLIKSKSHDKFFARSNPNYNFDIIKTIWQIPKFIFSNPDATSTYLDGHLQTLQVK